MVIFNVGKRMIIYILGLALSVSIGLNVFSMVKNAELKSNFESYKSFVDNADRTGLISYVAMSSIIQEKNEVEIFDIIEGQVVKKVKTNEEIQRQAKNIIKSITGLYVKINPLPDKGYIVRIPFYPAVTVKAALLNDYGINSVKEVFIIFTDDENPYLMVMDYKFRPYFYNFSEKTDKLKEILGF